MTPKVLLHGVPETTAIWDRIAPMLRGDITVLALPGFASPRPEGFDATMGAYADWLIAELAAFGEPVDLVGHDWGGILTARVATTAPESLRSWVSDAVGALQPSFRWHDLALIWQTEGAGEEFWTSMMADRTASADLLSGFGIPLDDALTIAHALDETMADSILRLYRSADGIGTAWATAATVSTPGLVLAGDSDPFGDPVGAAATAEQLGAQFRVLTDAGHFWPAQAPRAGADAINEFWDGIAP